MLVVAPPPETKPVIFGAPMLPDPQRLAALTGEALSRSWLTNGGVLHERLEAHLSGQQAEGDAALLTSSGTMALTLALGLAHLPKGAEVITTPVTFAATAQAIAWSGLTPVFADVDPRTLNLCPRAVRAAITPRTAAILPVHFLGVPCDVSGLQEVASEHGLWLAYDAAHAYGVTLHDQPIGHFGDATAFSLHATKLLHTGEGGMVVTRRSKAEALRTMRNFGITAGQPSGMGLNGKMSEFNAAVGLALLPDLEAEIAARRVLRKEYDVALGTFPDVLLPVQPEGASEPLVAYALRLPPPLSGRVHQALIAGGILTRGPFPILCGPGTAWPDAAIVTGDGGPALAPGLAPEVLCLPFHARVTPEDVNRITRIFRMVLGAPSRQRDRTLA